MMLMQVARRRAISSSEISTACCSVPTEVTTTLMGSISAMALTVTRGRALVKPTKRMYIVDDP